jgi:polyhydroxyalkanoate depolymerase
LLYQLYQAQRDLAMSVSAMADLSSRWWDLLPDVPATRFASAVNRLVARAPLTHTRPPFGISSVAIDGRVVPVHETEVMTTPFGSLVHFAKDGGGPPRPGDQPRVLVVAALAGHFSTLLRSTVATLLPDHDVFLTDWRNARDIPLDEGGFGLDDYVDHLVDFLQCVGPGAHLLAVCQPCPAALVATAVMAEGGHPATPASLTLMAGPVDGRVNPTAVNQLAMERPLDWFERTVIATVPWRFAGRGRRVYPGFLQLAGFMSLNFERHAQQQLALLRSLVAGDEARAGSIAEFYDEYNAVLDLAAEFYLETVDRVFQRFLLPDGRYRHRGRLVDMGAIRDTGLLTVEGARDDICGLGQTMAAQELCTGIPRGRRRHHLQAGVGHYGVFSGSVWEREISGVVRDFILANQSA